LWNKGTFDEEANAAYSGLLELVAGQWLEPDRHRRLSAIRRLRSPAFTNFFNDIESAGRNAGAFVRFACGERLGLMNAERRAGTAISPGLRESAANRPNRWEAGAMRSARSDVASLPLIVE